MNQAAPYPRIWSEESDLGPTRWYWRDAECDEDIGPFDSYRDAVRDFNDCRPMHDYKPVFSSDTGASQ